MCTPKSGCVKDGTDGLGGTKCVCYAKENMLASPLMPELSFESHWMIKLRSMQLLPSLRADRCIGKIFLLVFDDTFQTRAESLMLSGPA